MADRTIVLDNFRGGEWGLLGGEKSPAGSFHGKNVMVYSDGLIGPRPGLKNHTPSDMPNGLLRMLVESPTPDREAVFMIGNTVYYSSFRDFSIPPTAFTGDEPTGYGYAVYPKPETATFLVPIPDVVDGDSSGGVYRLNQIDGTVTKISDSRAASELEVYGSQLVTNEKKDESPRMWGTAPGDLEDWPAEYFVDIGDNWYVAAIRKQGNFLVVFKRNSIHTLSGVFGEDNMVVRDAEYNVNGFTHKPWHVDVDADGRIWFINLFRENLGSFTQSGVSQLGQLPGLSPRVGEDENLPLKRGLTCFDGQLDSSSIVAIQGGGVNKGMVRHNGVWTYHQFETEVSGMVRGFGDHYITTDGGGEESPAQLYMGLFNLDRPAFTDDPRSSPGDGSDTPLDAEFTLPVWLDREGNDVRVRWVSVEFKKWNTGVELNSIHCTVTTINRPNGAGDYVNEELYWNEAGIDSPDDGTHDRWVQPMHCGLGQGFQIRLHNLVGVAIKSITVGVQDFETPRKE